MGNEVQNTNGRQDGGWMEYIDRAMRDPAFDVAKLEKLIELHDRQMTEQAREDAANAMSELQRRVEQVQRDTKNSGLNNKRYASLAKIDEAIRPIYTELGFSVIVSEELDPRPEWIHFSALVSRGRWSRTVHLYAKRENIKGNRTQIQEAGSIATYMRRYLLCMAFNIITAEDVAHDNDGNKVKPPEVKEFLDYLSGKCKDAKTEADMNAIVKDGKILQRLDRLREDYQADWKTASEIISGMRARLAPHIIDQGGTPTDKPAGEHLV